MAATAYAALVSLMNTMDQIQVHPFLDNSHFASLRRMVNVLVEFVEEYSDANAMIPEENDDMLADADSSDLLSRIAVVAQTAEDIIEVEAAAQKIGFSTEENRGYSHDMPKMIQDMDFLIKEVVVKKDGRILKDEERTPKASMAPLSSSSSSSSASPAAAKTNKMVGFHDHLIQLLDRLKSDQPRRQIIPIVGMGGIGKTTLARNAYEHPLTVEHFDRRVWVVVSQPFSRRNILLQALSYLSPKGSTGERETYATDDDRLLGYALHQILFDRRYLIVLDDVWSMEAWEEIMLFFPDNENGSRIVVTTRQRDVVSHLGFSSPLVVKFLDEKSSWELFCDKAFARKDCPPELQGAGKEIVEKCEGLPLAITVVGGLLGKSPMTPEHWEKIARDKSQILEAGSGEGNKILSILYTTTYKHLPAYLKSCFGGFDGEDSRRENKVLSILYLSYKHLPVYLKSCFLCIGLFPKYHKINKAQLIQLWIAQGFIKAADNSSPCQSLEEIAEGYIMNLVDRNLLLVENYSLIGDKSLYMLPS